MKKKTLEFLEAHKSETPSTWREEAKETRQLAPTAAITEGCR